MVQVHKICRKFYAAKAPFELVKSKVCRQIDVLVIKPYLNQGFRKYSLSGGEESYHRIEMGSKVPKIPSVGKKLRIVSTVNSGYKGS